MLHNDVSHCQYLFSCYASQRHDGFRPLESRRRDGPRHAPKIAAARQNAAKATAAGWPDAHQRRKQAQKAAEASGDAPGLTSSPSIARARASISSQQAWQPQARAASPGTRRHASGRARQHHPRDRRHSKAITATPCLHRVDLHLALVVDEVAPQRRQAPRPHVRQPSTIAVSSRQPTPAATSTTPSGQDAFHPGVTWTVTSARSRPSRRAS